MGFNLQDKEMGSDYGADAFLLQAPMFNGGGIIFGPFLFSLSFHSGQK